MNVRGSRPADARNTDEVGLLALLSGLGDRGLTKDLLAEFVAQILVSTPSARIRDAAALALVDLQATHQAAALISVMERSDLANSIGTLVFALDELGLALPLRVAVQIAEHGSYEAKAEVVLLAEAGRLAMPADAEERERHRRRLADLSTAADVDVRESASAIQGALPDC